MLKRCLTASMFPGVVTVYRSCLDAAIEPQCFDYDYGGYCYCTTNGCNGICPSWDCSENATHPNGTYSTSSLPPSFTRSVGLSVSCYQCDSYSNSGCIDMSSPSIINQVCYGVSCFTSYTYTTNNSSGKGDKKRSYSLI